MSVEFKLTGDALWERMNTAVDKIQERLERTTQALESASIRYAIVGGNNEVLNIDLVRHLCNLLDELKPRTKN